MPLLANRAIAWLIVLALPLQAVFAASTAPRGPAHVHLAPTSQDDPHAAHAHGDIEHHHHDAGEGAIEVGDDTDHHHDAAIAETGRKSGIDGSADALIATPAGFRLDDANPGLFPGNAPKPPHGFIGRLERPPKPGPIRAL